MGPHKGWVCFDDISRCQSCFPKHHGQDTHPQHEEKRYSETVCQPVPMETWKMQHNTPFWKLPIRQLLQHINWPGPRMPTLPHCLPFLQCQPHWTRRWLTGPPYPRVYRWWQSQPKTNEPDGITWRSPRVEHHTPGRIWNRRDVLLATKQLIHSAQDAYPPSPDCQLPSMATWSCHHIQISRGDHQWGTLLFSPCNIHHHKGNRMSDSLALITQFWQLALNIGREKHSVRAKRETRLVSYDIWWVTKKDSGLSPCTDLRKKHCNIMSCDPVNFLGRQTKFLSLLPWVGIFILHIFQMFLLSNYIANLEHEWVEWSSQWGGTKDVRWTWGRV